MKLLLIDNYDSFTYNLVHLFECISEVEIVVARNDSIPFNQLDSSVFDGIIIGPGPGDPTDDKYFGQNKRVLENYSTNGLPTLGICLGFQGIADFYGASLKQAILPQHGKTSQLKITDSRGMLEGIPEGIEVMRYHSLMIDAEKPFEENLIINAEVNPGSQTVRANGREIMAISHKSLPIHGLQFHPESFATELGDIMANNFIKIIKQSQ